MSVAISMSSQPSRDWDAFVAEHSESSLYHRSAWSNLALEVFGHTPGFIEARSGAGELLGVLPIVRQKSLLFGCFATSIPFFNYGGALAVSDPVRWQLMERARSVAAEWGCSYLELRDRRAHAENWIERTDKVTMLLELPPTFEILTQRLGAKLRSQVRRVDREDVRVLVGRGELLDSFYDVFCRNMQSLGTPVYPRKFFEAVLARFERESLLVCVQRGSTTMAAAFLLINGTDAEIPWAACREDAKPLGFNMKLYWEVLSVVIGLGCTRFDFGRSTANSGTFNFKKQWGACPVQLYWHRWERNVKTRSDAVPGRSGMGMLRAARVWKTLPLPVANLLGPLISPWLPW